jgi:sodium-dependent phosphate transporter
MVLTEYTYVFVIGTFFALLDAYNNGANDVASKDPHPLGEWAIY